MEKEKILVFIHITYLCVGSWDFFYADTISAEMNANISKTLKLHILQYAESANYLTCTFSKGPNILYFSQEFHPHISSMLILSTSNIHYRRRLLLLLNRKINLEHKYLEWQANIDIIYCTSLLCNMLVTTYSSIAHLIKNNIYSVWIHCEYGTFASFKISKVTFQYIDTVL